jgi:hypothetical protein
MMLREEVGLKLVPEGSRRRRGLSTSTFRAGPIGGEKADVCITYPKVEASHHRETRGVFKTSDRTQQTRAFYDDLSPNIFMIVSVPRFCEEHFNGRART